jgi:N-acetylneuraminic acid mutarotase
MNKHLTLTFIVLISSLQYTSAQLWEDLADVPEDLTFPVVAVIDSHIHVMGGGGASGATDAHYRYDPSTDSWSTRAVVPYLAQQPAGAAVGGMIHYFGGGFPNSGTPLDDHHIYNPGSDSWSSGSTLTAPRAIHYGVELNDTLYSIAGQGMKTLFEKYDPSDSSWSSKATLPDANFWYGAHVTLGGKIYRFGGGGWSSPASSAHVYDPTADQWTALPSMPSPSHAINGAPIGDSIYLVGGYNNFLGTTDVWIYDVVAKTYTAGPALPIERYYHRLVAIGSCIYAIGGTSDSTLDSLGTSIQRYCLGNMPSTIRETDLTFDFSVRFNGMEIELIVPAIANKDGYQVQIFDMMGRIHNYASGAANQKQLTLSATELPAAAYIVQVATPSGVANKKLIIGR